MTRKYRIVKTPVGYQFQYRVLGLFWCFYTEDYYFRGQYGIWTRSTDKKDCIKSTLEEANFYLDFIREYPMWYRGHKIVYGQTYGHTVYVDYTDRTDHLRYPEFNKVCNSLEELKKEIDSDIEDEHRERHKHDILEVI